MDRSALGAGEVRDLGEALRELLVGGNVIAHLAVVELLIGEHVEVARAGQAEDDRFFFAFFLAAQRFANGGESVKQRTRMRPCSAPESS